MIFNQTEIILNLHVVTEGNCIPIPIRLNYLVCQ